MAPEQTRKTPSPAPEATTPSAAKIRWDDTRSFLMIYRCEASKYQFGNCRTHLSRC